MWNFEGIKQISTLLLAFKVASVTWSLFEEEKEESVEISDLDFRKSRVVLKRVPLKGDVEQTYEYNT